MTALKQPKVTEGDLEVIVSIDYTEQFDYKPVFKTERHHHTKIISTPIIIHHYHDHHFKGWKLWFLLLLFHVGVRLGHLLWWQRWGSTIICQTIRSRFILMLWYNNLKVPQYYTVMILWHNVKLATMRFNDSFVKLNHEVVIKKGQNCLGNVDIMAGMISNCHEKVPSTSWSLLPMSSVEQTSKAQLLLSLPKAKLFFLQYMTTFLHQCSNAKMLLQNDKCSVLCDILWFESEFSVLATQLLPTSGLSLQ